MRHMEAFHKGNSQRKFHQSFKSQSAMEYLMTYGWAILIIAVVLAALFELGVFNPMTFAPKASPGSCQVVRPEGAGTTNFISLEGECNGELPQYAAQFNGGSSTAIIVNNPTSVSQYAMTVTAWVKPGPYPGGRLKIVGNNCCGGNNNFYLDVYEGGSGSTTFYVADSGWTNVNSPTGLFNPKTWVFVVGRYNGSYISIWVNGIFEGSLATSGALPSPTGNIGIGGGNGDSPFNGSIANIQIYNTALSSNDIKALYQEGIGGAPINLQSLVGWWPLNGNSNDYSGNNNNGVPAGITYTSNWYSGYTSP